MRHSAFDVLAADLPSLRDLAEKPEDRVGRLVRAAGSALVLVLAEDCSISLSLTAMP